jgi:tetratricopeptide (TPR) repeat protein
MTNTSGPSVRATARVQRDLEAGMQRTERKRGARWWLALMMAATLVAAMMATAGAQSIDDLRRTVAQSPADAEAWTLLGDALLAGDDLAGAKEAYLEAIAVDYLTGDAHFGLGLVEFGRGDFAAALFSFTEVTRLYTDRFDGHFNRAVTLARLRRPAESAASFRRALAEAEPEATPDDRLNAWTGLGTQLVLAGEPGSAADAFAEALKLDPEDTDLAYRRGSALLSAGRGLEALAELTDIEARTSDYRFSSLIAEVYLEQGQVDRALRALERAERKAQTAGDRAGQAASLMALGEVQRGLGRDADATASYLRASEADPDSWEARYALGVAYLAAGQPRSAVAPLLEAVALVPDNGDVRLALASAYDQMGQAGDALATAREALARANGAEAQSQARFIIGRALYLQGDYAGAGNEFAMVVQQRPGSASAQLWAGLAQYQQGDHAGAALFYERSVQLDPNSVEARVNLGAAYLASQRYRDAESVYRFLVQQNARDAESLYHLGWSLYAQQRDEDARTSWTQSCQLGYQAACSAPR